jgi:hypothetical protein
LPEQLKKNCSSSEKITSAKAGGRRRTPPGASRRRKLRQPRNTTESGASDVEAAAAAEVQGKWSPSDGAGEVGEWGMGEDRGERRRREKGRRGRGGERAETKRRDVGDRLSPVVLRRGRRRTSSLGRPHSSLRGAGARKNWCVHQQILPNFFFFSFANGYVSVALMFISRRSEADSNATLFLLSTPFPKCLSYSICDSQTFSDLTRLYIFFENLVQELCYFI